MDFSTLNGNRGTHLKSKEVASALGIRYKNGGHSPQQSDAKAKHPLGYSTGAVCCPEWRDT
jgi:hypothetical protein